LSLAFREPSSLFNPSPSARRVDRATQRVRRMAAADLRALGPFARVSGVEVARLGNVHVPMCFLLIRIVASIGAPIVE
jgi:hypothetical protein